jgi:hypothetical protein
MSETLTARSPRQYSSVQEIQNVWKKYSNGFLPTKPDHATANVQYPTATRVKNVPFKRMRTSYEKSTTTTKPGNGCQARQVFKQPAKCSFCSTTGHRNQGTSCPKRSGYGRIVPPEDVKNFSTFLCNEAPLGRYVGGVDLTKISINLNSGKQRHIQVRTVHPLQDLTSQRVVSLSNLAFDVAIIGGDKNDKTFSGKITGEDLQKFLSVTHEKRHVFDVVKTSSCGPDFLARSGMAVERHNNSITPGLPTRLSQDSHSYNNAGQYGNYFGGRYQQSFNPSSYQGAAQHTNYYGYANGLQQGAHSISNTIRPYVQNAKDSDRNKDHQQEDNGFRPAAGFFGGTDM